MSSHPKTKCSKTCKAVTTKKTPLAFGPKSPLMQMVNEVIKQWVLSDRVKITVLFRTEYHRH